MIQHGPPSPRFTSFCLFCSLWSYSAIRSSVRLSSPALKGREMWTGKRIVTRTSYPSIAPEWLCQSTLASQAQTTSMPISSKGPRARTPTLHARDHSPTPVSMHILSFSYKHCQIKFHWQSDNPVKWNCSVYFSYYFFEEYNLIKPHLCNTCSRIVRRMAGSRWCPELPSRRSCYLTYFQSTISGGWWLSAKCRSLSWLATSRRRGNTSAKSTGQILQVNTSILSLTNNARAWSYCCWEYLCSTFLSLFRWHYVHGFRWPCCRADFRQIQRLSPQVKRNLPGFPCQDDEAQVEKRGLGYWNPRHRSVSWSMSFNVMDFLAKGQAQLVGLWDIASISDNKVSISPPVR